MKKFTFDTNCMIDIELNRPSAPFIQKIVQAHRDEKVDAAFVAVSASERQKGDYFLDTYDDFVGRLRSLGLDDVPQILGMSYWGISYWGNALFTDEGMLNREREIHNILFSKLEFDYCDFARSNEIIDDDALSLKAFKWRNAWCDRQMLWAHDFHARDVFVTSDKNFKEKMDQITSENITICTPKEAAQLLPWKPNR